MTSKGQKFRKYPLELKGAILKELKMVVNHYQITRN